MTAQTTRLAKLERQTPANVDRCPSCPSVAFAYQDHADDPVAVVCIACGRPAKTLIVFAYDDVQELKA